MQTDVKATYLTADGVVVAGRARLKGLVVAVATLGANPVVIYDNASAASGTTIFSVSCAGVAGTFCVVIPGEGILAVNGLFCDTGSAASITAFYG